MSDNPWIGLPKTPPYVLPEHAALVREFNTNANIRPNRFLHVDKILPEAFTGDRNAPILLLSNNPGFTEENVPIKQRRDFMEKMRKNLRHEPLPYPFLFLDPAFRENRKNWWERKLVELLAEFGREVISRSILNIPYFPYPSRRFSHATLMDQLTSTYSLELVEDAMERQAVIVFMRKEDYWLEKLPKLKKYDRRLKVKNTQTPSISRRNLPEGGFEMIRAAINVAGSKRQSSN